MCVCVCVCVCVCRRVSEIFLVKDMSRIPNYLWFEYTSVRQETKFVCLFVFLLIMLCGYFLYVCRKRLRRKSS